MPKIINPLISSIIPSKEDVLKFQNVNNINDVSNILTDNLEYSLRLLKEKSNPIAIVKELLKSDFDNIYQGEGENAVDSPLPNIIKKAEKLHLFAVTIGDHITKEINKYFYQNEFPIGSFIDSGASLTADNIVGILENHVANESTTLAYSPGYCGWHVSGQRKLFQYLKPEQIGITLNNSYLMTPLKSVSGVLVSGPSNIHTFDNNYSFCEECTTYSCKIRMKSITKV
ncbi:vitamin B12 dependent-methionine synthase activation domain-containing protein [Candidatus Neomarinimicrobiota bacterium]